MKQTRKNHQTALSEKQNKSDNDSILNADKKAFRIPSQRER